MTYGQYCIEIYGSVIKKGLFYEHCKNEMIKNINNENIKPYLRIDELGNRELRHSDVIRFLDDEKYFELNFDKSFLVDLPNGFSIVKCKSKSNHNNEFDGHFTWYVGVIFSDLSIDTQNYNIYMDIANLFKYTKLYEKFYNKNKHLLIGDDYPQIHYTFNLESNQNFVKPDCCAMNENIASIFEIPEIEIPDYMDTDLSPIPYMISPEFCFPPMPSPAVRQPSSGVRSVDSGKINIEYEDLSIMNLPSKSFCERFIVMNSRLQELDTHRPTKRRRKS